MSAHESNAAKTLTHPSAGDGCQDREPIVPIGQHLQSMTIVGNSMEPALWANETVSYLPTCKITDDGLYVFMLDGELKVKYLQRYAGGAIQIIPGNPIYEKELLIPVEDAPGTYRSQQSGLVGRFEVVGKVIRSAERPCSQNGASSMGCTSSGGKCRALSAT